MCGAVMPIYKVVGLPTGSWTGMARKKTRKSVRGKARRKARKQVPLGVLIWTAIILFVLVVFLFNRVAIRDVVERTQLLTVLQRSVDDAVGRGNPSGEATPLAVGTGSSPPRAAAGDAALQQEAPSDQTRSRVVATDPAPATDSTPATDPARAAETAPASEAALPVATAPAPSEAPPPVVAATPAAAPVQAEASPPQPVPSARQRRLFFAAVSAAGEIAVTGVLRAVDDTASPLTETLKTLFAGPDPSELDQGLITMIPPAVTLNRVYVNERIAYIDVSESFRFNPLGREGLHAQLQQIVFSATEFPGVEMVQILIDGRRVEFLGPEGTYIGEPIGRAMFFGAPPATP